MNPDYHGMAMDLLNSGMGDEGRLRFILECIAKNKPLYKTDMMFLESMNNRLESKIQRLQGNTPRSEKPKENSRTLISDEYLDKHIEEIMDSKNAKVDAIIRKKSFLARLFFR